MIIQHPLTGVILDERTVRNTEEFSNVGRLILSLNGSPALNENTWSDLINETCDYVCPYINLIPLVSVPSETGLGKHELEHKNLIIKNVTSNFLDQTKIGPFSQSLQVFVDPYSEFGAAGYETKQIETQTNMLSTLTDPIKEMENGTNQPIETASNQGSCYEKINVNNIKHSYHIINNMIEAAKYAKLAGSSVDMLKTLKEITKPIYDECKNLGDLDRKVSIPEKDGPLLFFQYLRAVKWAPIKLYIEKINFATCVPKEYVLITIESGVDIKR